MAIPTSPDQERHSIASKLCIVKMGWTLPTLGLVDVEAGGRTAVGADRPNLPVADHSRFKKRSLHTNARLDHPHVNVGWTMAIATESSLSLPFHVE